MKYLLIPFLLLSGCLGQGVRPVSYNGHELYESMCNGTVRSFADCMEQASDKCAETGRKAVEISSDGSSSVAQISGRITPALRRNFLFKCEQ